MKLRQEKGVTLLVLTITIIVLLIITSITIGNFQNQLGKKNLNNLYSDIESINAKISEYYLKNDSLPIFQENAYMNSSSQLNLLFKTNGGKGTLINTNDENLYYVINLSKLENLTLNYGREYSNWDNNSTYEKYQDVYIINEVTHQIYYPKGVRYNGKTYFTSSNDAQEVNKVENTEISDDELELIINKTNKHCISDSDKIILDADITLNIGSNFIRDTLEYGWDIFENADITYTKFDLDLSNSATLMSKQLDNVSGYYLYIKILDTNGNEHILKQFVINIEETVKLAVENGTIGENNWYISDVTVKVNQSDIEENQEMKIMYKLTGDTTQSETEIKAGDTITITNDGKTNITLYVKDESNNKIEVDKLEIKKDSIPPSITSPDDILVNIGTSVDNNFIMNKNTITDNLTTVKISDLEIKYSDKNIATADLSKYDIYTLNYNLKDEAGNTKKVVQEVTTKPTTSITLKNLIPNPSFENSNSFDGWGNWGANMTFKEIATDKKRSGTSSFKYTFSGGQAFPRKNFGNFGMKGKYIYGGVHANTDYDEGHPIFYFYSAGSADLFPSEISHNQYTDPIEPCYNTWGRITCLLTPSVTLYDYAVIMLAQARNTTEAYTIWWDDLYAIDLTPFGSNVPTKKWLDKMLIYFEGTKSFSW